jgi:hypothetical protein
MDISKYETTRFDEFTYQFFSCGPKGRFEIRVVFTPYTFISSRTIYNLGFGLWDPVLQSLNDGVELRNGDADKILSTVAQVAASFLRTHLSALLFAQGSTPARTRKYQMGVSRFFSSISQEFVLMGLMETDSEREDELTREWIPFAPGFNFKAFLLYIR